MKKTYIEPQNTVVALKVRANILQTSPVTETSGVDGLGVYRGTTPGGEGGTSEGGIFTASGREAVSAPDAWDEW